MDLVCGVSLMFNGMSCWISGSLAEIADSKGVLAILSGFQKISSPPALEAVRPTTSRGFICLVFSWANRSPLLFVSGLFTKEVRFAPNVGSVWFGS